MQPGMNAEPPRRAHHPPRSNLGGQPRRDGIDRLRQRVPQADLALIDAGIIARRPAGHRGRPVIGDRLGRIAAL